MPARKVAVVTGSNKGIGYAIVRGLLRSKDFDGDVFLLSRDVARGEAAVRKLESEEGLKAQFHQFDIDDADSVRRLRDAMSSRYGGIDVLVNNVGIAFKNADGVPFAEQATVTMRTNYHGTVRACDELVPIVKDGGRIVNVSSWLGLSNLRKCSDELQRFFRSDQLTVDALTAKMRDFVKHAQTGAHQAAGYPDSAYGMSKVGMTALTRVWARKLKADGSAKRGIVINACCPGWVRTDLGGHNASKSTDEGAITPLYLALLPPGTTSPYGEFVSSKKIQEWS